MTNSWYDPTLSYEENFSRGPSDFIAQSSSTPSGEYTFFGKSLRFPFGIPAGPLLNGAYVSAALDAGFDVPVYKTVRTRAYNCHPYPNVLPVEVEGDLTLEKASKGITVADNYGAPLSITNSFGVPSKDPSFWQDDMSRVARLAKEGQHVVGSFQGTAWEGGTSEGYVNDWVLGAKLVKETGVSALEANLSCPNEGANHLLCFDTDKTERIIDKIKMEIGDTPLIIKIAYFEEAPLREFVSKVGNIADGISSINTIAADVRDKAGKQALPGEGRLKSGICGSGILWAGLTMTKRLSTLRNELGHSYAIIGVGGVTKPSDFTAYREAGADVVMSATGAMWNPNLAYEIQSEHV